MDSDIKCKLCGQNKATTTYNQWNFTKNSFDVIMVCKRCKDIISA